MSRTQAATAMMALGATLAFVAGAFALYLVRHDGDAPNATPPAAAARDPHEVTSQVIAFFQARVERDPLDFISYSKLGDAYVRQARETGDISAYQRAQTAFDRALELFPDDRSAQAGRASVHFSLHDFAGALAIARDVYAADPGATSALATIGDADLAIGNYDEATTAYGTLADAASGASVLSREAHLDELRGNIDRAVELMKQAEAASAASPTSTEALAFYRLQLGNLYFNSGRYDDAEHWLGGALDGFPDYYPALAGLGNVSAARGDYQQAIGYYERSVAIVPLPVVLAALGDTYARIGDDRAAQKQYATVEFIGKLAEINKVLYNRELAIFYSDHRTKTSTAVELATAELDRRRDVYGYDALAWALYRDGRPRDAAPYARQALALGTRDAKMLFHAGLIDRANGDGARAKDELEQALDLNPHFSVLLEQEAHQALAQIDSGASVEGGR
jgi:tetratricopeptide (TPR) repeat protein